MRWSLLLVMFAVMAPGCVVGRDCVDECEDSCPVAPDGDFERCPQACYQARCRAPRADE